MEFLTYGAIGIAMVLIVLSYKLLSKEQDREDVRDPMLKSIKSYITLALILAAFFGVTEIVSMLVSGNSEAQSLSSEIERIYNRNFKEGENKSLNDKLATIDESLRKGTTSKSEETGEKDKEIAELRKMVERADFGKYVDFVLQLKDSVDSSYKSFINLTHKVDSKSHYYQMLGDILIYLDELEVSDKSSNARILEKWGELKKTYAYLGNTDKNRVEWIVGSDITELLKRGHR